MKANDSALEIASTFAQANEEIRSAVGRMRGAVLSSAIDCECRDRVDGALPMSNGEGSRRCSCCLPISTRTNPRRWTTA